MNSTNILILILFVGMICTFPLSNVNASHVQYNSLHEPNVSATDLTVNNIHGTTHHYTFIKAYLTDIHGKPLSNKIITYNIEGDSRTYIAVTSTSGYALLYYYIFQNAGTYPINANFQGDQTYTASTSTSKLTVE